MSIEHNLLQEIIDLSSQMIKLQKENSELKEKLKHAIDLLEKLNAFKQKNNN